MFRSTGLSTLALRLSLKQKDCRHMKQVSCCMLPTCQPRILLQAELDREWELILYGQAGPQHHLYLACVWM